MFYMFYLCKCFLDLDDTFHHEIEGLKHTLLSCKLSKKSLKTTEYDALQTRKRRYVIKPLSQNEPTL